MIITKSRKNLIVDSKNQFIQVLQHNVNNRPAYVNVSESVIQ